MMTMTSVNDDFAHWRSIAHIRARDTASQRKTQPKDDAALQRGGVIRWHHAK